MAKSYYQTPDLTIRLVRFSSAILSGSFGDPGKAGKELDELDELSF
ncbi:MAG: hypothetical protein J6O51_05005 [Bacteroidales bacterium]|nr:hypothetical protein [Bacteroidales bacterium]